MKFLNCLFSSVLAGMVVCPVNAYEIQNLAEEDSNFAIIEENNRYISENLEELFLEEMNSDNNISDSVVTADCEGIQSDDPSEDLNALTYVIQDETLVQGSYDSPSIQALTVASALSIPQKYNGAAYDSTVSVYAYSTIYYYEKTVSGMKYYQFYYAKGGYNIKQTGVLVKKQEVKCGISGWNYSEIVYDKTIKINPTSSTWDVSTGFDQYAHLSEFGYMGTTYTITLQRSSSSWSFNQITQLSS